MKTQLFVALASLLIGISSQGQSLTQTSTAPQDTVYSVVGRGPHSSTWEKTTYSQLLSGDWVTNLQHYMETATGLNYWDSSSRQWQPSNPEILSSSNGFSALTVQHTVTLAANLATVGAISLTTPDGQRLSMHLLGLCYADQASGKSVWIAEVTNSFGHLIASNQVWYENAFSGVSGSASYVNTLAGLEQNVVLEAQPPPPETYGLNSQTTVIQAITEFLSPPAPVISTSANSGDETIRFGTLQFSRGSAFLMGSQSGRVAVQKQWITQNGRWFLVEQVPIAQIASQLDALPAGQTASIKRRRGSVLNLVSKKRLWPTGFAGNGRKGVKMLGQGSSPEKRAERALATPTFVLDYVTLNTSQTNWVFAGDTTYYIDGFVSLSGITTFEGETVIKFATNGSLSTDGSLVCNTGPYRPACFTSKDDNSIGDSISESSGNPTEGGSYLIINTDNITNLHDLRFTYAANAIQSDNENIWNSQFIKCHEPLLVWHNISLYNVLFGGCAYAIGPIYGGTIVGKNLTTDSTLLDGFTQTLCLTNCVLLDGLEAGTNNVGYNVSSVNLYMDGVSYVPGPLFQTVGAGSYYLTNSSPCRNAGTTNIDPVLLAALANKTTYPPILYSNVVFSNNLVLNPQAQRDYDAPDLGYHYDSIDYLVDNFWVTNATLIVTNGAVLAGYNDSDVLITDGSSIISVGSPLAPNWFTRYSCVQEQPLNLGMGTPSPGAAEMVNPFHATNEPAGLFRFTKFSCPAGGGDHLVHAQINSAYSNLLVQDCEFWSGTNDFSGFNNTFAILKNNLFVRSGVGTASAAYTNNSLAVSNNLFWNTRFVIRPLGNSNTWFFFNNDFDNCSLGFGSQPQLPVNGYNAYLVNTNRLNPTNAFDIVTTNDIAYQTGPLGTFYQPTNSVLINAGSCTADQTGLYHYTTTTNEVPETNSPVDIGYHYVALNANGNPLDSNGDGIPDYLEDANGNGLVDSGEIGWNINGDLGLNVLITRPENNSLIP